MIPQLSAATLGTKLLVLGGLLAIVFGGGFAGGCRWQKGEVAEAQSAQKDAERDRDGWRDAANELRSAAAAQKDEVRKAQAAAAVEKQRADKAVSEANKAADKFLNRLAEMNHQAEADKVKCEAERARVCGAPLR